MKTIELTKGKHTVVDDLDYEWLNQYNWFANKTGRGSKKYRAIRNKTNGCQFIYMHRMILGVTDSKILVDHEDGNPLNNQRYNIRVCNYSENASNAESAKGSSSKYLGVSDYRGKSWRVTITKNRKQITVGYFSSEIDAAKAYNVAATKYHGRFAKLNIVK